jgi:chromosome segregation ATPase
MSKDLTQKLNGSLEDKVDRLITIVQSMDTRLAAVGDRLAGLEDRLTTVDNRLAGLEDRLTRVDNQLAGLEDRLTTVDNRLAGFEDRLASVQDGLASLETKVDDRLKDTRPMWEVVQTQLAEFRQSQDRLRGEMEKGFRLVDRRLENQPVEYDRLYRYHRDLEERVEKIEKQLS